MSTKRGKWVPVPVRTRATITEFEEIFGRAPTADDAVVRPVGSVGMLAWYYFYGEAEAQVRPCLRRRAPLGDMKNHSNRTPCFLQSFLSLATAEWPTQRQRT